MDYFDRQPATTRKAIELPWQLQKAVEKQRLQEQLLKIPFCMLMCTTRRTDLIGYWIWLKRDRDAGKLYLRSFRHWAQTEKLRVVIDVCAKHLSTLLVTFGHYPEAEELMRIYGEELQGDRGHGALLPDVPPVARHLANIVEKSLLEEHTIDAAEALVKRGVILYETGRYEEAERLLEFARAIEEHRLGKDDPEVADILRHLSWLFQATNRFEEAERVIRRALSIDEEALGADHPILARDLDNLAVLLHRTDRPDEALPLIQRAIALDERNFGKNDPRLAGPLGTLAGFLIDADRLVEAEPLIRRVLRREEEKSGRQHPDVAVALSWLGRLLQKTGRLKEGEQALMRAVSILLKSTKLTGITHPLLSKLAAQFVEILMRAGLAQEQAVARFNKLSRQHGLKLEFKVKSVRLS